MRAAFLVMVLAASVGIANPAAATTMFPEQFTCPIGGEEFEDYVIGSTSSFGQRPDGKAIGGVSPWPVVECPGNGFPIFQEKFSADELARLTAIVETPRFAALRGEASYYRVWFLREALGTDAYALVGDLLAASWQVDDDPPRKARYQRQVAAAAEALEWSEERRDDWFWYNLRAANAYRELGEFEKAEHMLEAIDKPELLPTEADQREGARFLIDGLRPLIAERNSASEPTNLIGASAAAWRCREAPADMTETEQSACDSPAVLERIAEIEQHERARRVGEGTSEQAMQDAAEAEADLEAALMEEEADLMEEFTGNAKAKELGDQP